MSVRIRDFTEDDAPFVFKSWVRSYSRTRHRLFAAIPPWRLTKFHRPFIDALAARSRILLCELETPAGAESLGFVVYETPVLHYMYVKRDYRRQGVGRSLLDRAEDDGVLLVTSHDTYDWRGFREAIGRRFEWSPGEAFYPPGENREAQNGPRTRRRPRPQGAPGRSQRDDAT